MTIVARCEWINLGKPWSQLPKWLYINHLLPRKYTFTNSSILTLFSLNFSFLFSTSTVSHRTFLLLSKTPLFIQGETRRRETGGRSARTFSSHESSSLQCFMLGQKKPQNKTNKLQALHRSSIGGRFQGWSWVDELFQWPLTSPYGETPNPRCS